MSRAGAWHEGTSRPLLVLIAAATLLVSSATTAQEPAVGDAPSDDEVNEIAGDLYCPVCPNTPLDVCETLACSEWREQIREQIAAGMSEAEITDYFVEQYGERVLARPRRSGFTLILWVLPPLGIALGLLGLGIVLRGWRRNRHDDAMAAPQEVAVSAEARQRIEDELHNLS